MNIVKERTKNIAKLKELLARNGLPSEGNYTTYLIFLIRRLS
jgi:hypothetical protein